ncbi:MAG: hypothetical protein ABIX28_04545 [Vicinamibacterales bacterium]
MLARPTASSILAVLILSLAGIVGCGAPVDVKQAVQITDISGGWFDAGIKDGKNKLTPSVTFRVTKTTEDAIRPLALNLAFKKITATGEEEFDDFYIQNVSFGTGNVSDPLTVRTETGYTADPPQSRADMLKHKDFQDLRVIFFAKHSSSNWVELARFDLPRTLITR